MVVASTEITPINQVEFILVSSYEELRTTPFYTDLNQVDTIGLDTESTGLDYFSDQLLLVQLEVADLVYVIDVFGFGHEALNTVMQDIVNKDITCVAHNAKYDIQVIRQNSGVRLENVYCTMISENVIGAGLEEFYLPLDNLAEKYLGIVLDKLLRDQFIGSTVVVHEQLEYAAEDASCLRQIREAQLGRARALELENVVALENKLLPVVAWMEYEGVLLDAELWEKLTQEATESAEELKKEVLDELFNETKEEIMAQENALEACALLKVSHKKTKKMLAHLEGITEPEYIYSTVRGNFNLGSWQQLLCLLNLYGVPTTATNAKVLAPFKIDFEVVGKLLEYKEQAKLVSSFGKDYLQNINPVTGRLHANANQLGARSGRWSYTNPNLQQVPKDDTKKGNVYRQCFIARPGYKILTVDYDQAELRLLGAVTGEPEFIEAYKEGIDIHKLTASKIFHKEVEDVTKNERTQGKSINFAIVYGSSAYGLEFNFGIPFEEGKEHLKNYYLAYPYIKSFIDMAGNKIWELKYTRTPYGRKRFFEDRSYFKDMYEAERYMNAVKRQGINTIIQGGSADILKMALIRIYYNNPFGDWLKILMTVHDEIVCEIKEEIIEEATEYVIKCMVDAEQEFLGEIPAKVDYAVADTWSK